MGVIDDARTQTRLALCSVLNGLDAIDRFGVGLGIRGPVPSNFPGTPFGNIVNNGQGLFCDRMPNVRPPARTTGYCTTGYTVRFTFKTTVPSTGGVTDSPQVNNGVVGPIRSFAIASASSPRRIIANGPNGAQTIYESATADRVASNLVITSITRNDNQPDSCPIPPTTPLPDADRRRPININNNAGDIIFAFPILNVNGNLTVPFNLNVGELNLSGEVELNTGDINFNFGGQPVDPNTPEVPTPDGTPPDAPNDDPEEEKKANIIGVVVVSRESGNAPATELTFPNSPNVLIPRVATVQFKIRIKNKSHWTSEIPVRSKNAYIHCPAEIDAIDVAVTSDPGWIVSSTLVRGIVPSNQVVLI